MLLIICHLISSSSSRCIANKDESRLVVRERNNVDIRGGSATLTPRMSAPIEVRENQLSLTGIHECPLFDGSQQLPINHSFLIS